MSLTALVNARVLLTGGLRDNIAIVIENDHIVGIEADAPHDARRVDLKGALLLPGLIDTQVNGGGGKLFNDDPSVDTIRTIAAAHRRHGTTGVLPTLISDDPPAIARAIAAVDTAIEAGVPGVLGAHIEGPFLNPVRRGIHAERKLRRLTNDMVDLLCSARLGRTLVTLAPECATPAQITELTNRGVIVAAGHSDAAYETAQIAINAGVSGVTHLFNAMSQLTGRAPGLVGAALDDDRIFAGIIVDGHHLHAASVRLAVRVKGTDRLMLVTDAMSTVGGNQDEFLLDGRRIYRTGDRLQDDTGRLAGSTLTMTRAVRKVMQVAHLPLSDAITMASATPAAFLKLGDRGKIAVGNAADLIAVDDDLTVRASWICGRIEHF